MLSNLRDDEPALKAWLGGLSAPTAETKALARMPQQGAGGGGYNSGSGGIWDQVGAWPSPPGAKFDHVREAGELWRCSVVAICLGWLCDNFPTARLQVCTKGVNGQPDEPIDPHGMTDLFDTPNDFMIPEELWDALILSCKCDGNGYLIKARTAFGTGAPGELWWAPPWMVQPRWPEDGSTFIGWYDYSVNSQVYRLETTDVVHFRVGTDPYNSRKGCARLKSVVRSIVGINSSENYTAAILRNYGVSAGVWVPENEGDITDESTAEGIKQKLTRATGGENASKFHVMSFPGHFEKLGAGPQEMALDTILDRPEANICAVLGVNPMVAGLAVGASMRSYANQGEADRQSWNNGLVPLQDRMARVLQKQLLPDFGDPKGLIVTWDRTRVQALQEDATAKATRAVLMAGGPICTPDEGRAMVGLPPMTPAQLTEIQEAQQPAPGSDPNNPNDPNADPNVQDGKQP